MNKQQRSLLRILFTVIVYAVCAAVVHYTLGDGRLSFIDIGDTITLASDDFHGSGNIIRWGEKGGEASSCLANSFFGRYRLIKKTSDAVLVEYQSSRHYRDEFDNECPNGTRIAMEAVSFLRARQESIRQAEQQKSYKKEQSELRRQFEEK